MAVALLGADVESLDARALAARLGDVERAIRKLEAEAASIIATADRGELFRADGHVSVRGWVKASIRVADHTVTQRVRTARLCADVPVCHEELAAGRLGSIRSASWPGCMPTRVVATSSPPWSTNSSTWRQPTRMRCSPGRCGTGSGSPMPTAPTAPTRPPTPDAPRRWRWSMTTGYLDARVGAAQYAAMKDVFDRFAQAEFEAEWDELRARVGDDACPGMLERTESQRRADALAAIFHRAAAADPAAQRPRTRRQHRHRPGRLRNPAHRHGRRRQPSFDATDLAHQRCRTTNGIPIDPADAVAASLRGTGPAGGDRRRRGDHRPRPPRPSVHRLGPRRGPTPSRPRQRRPMSVARLRAPPMSNRPHPRMGPRRTHRRTQRRTPLPPPQPLENPRLPNLARPHRRLAHPPPRRHRNPSRLTACPPDVRSVRASRRSARRGRRRARPPSA